MKKLVFTIASALLCLGIIIGVINIYTDVFGGAGVSVEMTIPKGASGSEILDILDEKEVVDYPFLFKIYASLKGENSNYKSGDFTVNTGHSYKKLLKILTSEPNSMVSKVKITIPEGFEAESIADAMEKAGITSREDFLKAVSDDNYDFDFIDDIDKKGSRKYMLEGYLFPNTYIFYKDTSAKEVVSVMLKTFEDVISKYDIEDEDIDDVVTLASVIEREAVGNIDRRKVSSVFHNRLKGKGGLTKLQSCATVQYILGERKPVLSETDTRIKSPYNTYINEGLPVGPIANPGEEAIKAALNPEKTEYLYFGLNKNGEHIFSKTYQQHLEATR